METQINQLVGAIAGLAETVLPFLTLAAGAGVAAMGFVQMLKEAFYLRGHYHRWRVERWVKKVWDDKDLKGLVDIKNLMSGGRDFGLYALKTEELGQRFRMAARLVIANRSSTLTRSTRSYRRKSTSAALSFSSGETSAAHE